MPRSPWPTTRGVPTRADCYMKLLDHLRESQELAAMLGHLHNTETAPIDVTLAHGWLGISELLGQLCSQVTTMAQGKLN